MKNHLHILTGLMVMLLGIGAKAQDSRAYANQDVPLSHALEAKNQTEAWAEVEKACVFFPPSSHSETSGNMTAGDPRTKYIELWLIAAADKAHEFYTKFPNDTNVPSAKVKELDVLYEAFDESYSTNLFPRIFARANAIVRDANFDKTKRFNICYFIFSTTIANRNLLPANIDVGAELQKDARIAEKDFQDLEEFPLFAWLAGDIKAEKTRPMFREFSAGLQKLASDPYTRGYVMRGLLEVAGRQREAIGQPLALQFTNLNGQAVDTAEMKGKVITIHFWGTSYPQCLTNVLRLKTLYNKFHANGLEIVGVNVDCNSEILKKFVSDNKIAWPQYWDGKEMENKMVQATHVTRAGTTLLIDKKGLFRDINGDEDLEKKIKKLLAE